MTEILSDYKKLAHASGREKNYYPFFGGAMEYREHRKGPNKKMAEWGMEEIKGMY